MKRLRHALPLKGLTTRQPLSLQVRILVEAQLLGIVRLPVAADGGGLKLFRHIASENQRSLLQIMLCNGVVLVGLMNRFGGSPLAKQSLGTGSGDSAYRLHDTSSCRKGRHTDLRLLQLVSAQAILQQGPTTRVIIPGRVAAVVCCIPTQSSQKQARNECCKEPALQIQVLHGPDMLGSRN